LNLRLIPTFFRSASERKLIASIHNIFGFLPGNVFLYKLALLHKSAGYDAPTGARIDNERLEFLGDAILDAVTADYLFKMFPTRDEGFLTEMRSKMVNRAQLNKLSQTLGLDQLIQLDSTGVFRSFRGDALEAFIGAVYLDKGYRFCHTLIIKRIFRNHFDLDELVAQELNFKSKLIEWAQKEHKKIQFSVVEEVGHGYKRQYVVEVLLDDIPVARGQDFSIKGAEQIAAEKGWAKISGGNS
jgi:ribonuclease III